MRRSSLREVLHQRVDILSNTGSQVIIFVKPLLILESSDKFILENTPYQEVSWPESNRSKEESNVDNDHNENQQVICELVPSCHFCEEPSIEETKE